MASNGEICNNGRRSAEKPLAKKDEPATLMSFVAPEKILENIENIALYYDHVSFGPLVRDRRERRKKDCDRINAKLEQIQNSPLFPMGVSRQLADLAAEIEKTRSAPHWNPLMLPGSPDRRGLLARTELAARLLDSLLPGTTIAEAFMIEEARRHLEKAAEIMGGDEE